jgi:hypothetical protein
MSQCLTADLTHAALCGTAQPYYIGDDWSVKIQFNDSAGDPVDVAGMSFRGTIKDTAGTILLARDSADSAEIEILSPTTLGQIRVKINRTDTTVTRGSRHLLDVVRVAADASEQTWFVAYFEAQPRVTPTPLP